MPSKLARQALPLLGLVLVASAAFGFVLSRRGDDGDDVSVISAPGTTLGVAAIGTAPALTGEGLPDLPIETTDGATLRLGDLVGDPLVINLWFTSCRPCRDEMPEFQMVHSELGDSVRFVGLNVQDTGADARAYADEIGVAYEIFVEPRPLVAARLEVPVFPATLFVGADGSIRHLQLGELDATELRQAITRYLGV